jgi:hypothetical protein
MRLAHVSDMPWHVLTELGISKNVSGLNFLRGSSFIFMKLRVMK